MQTTFVYNFENKRIDSLECFMYVPDDMVGKKDIPLILFLHGAGERAPGFEWLFNNGFPMYVKQGEEFPAAILCPQCPRPFTWNNITAEVKELLDHIIMEYSVDPDRVSVTGLSMGGFGTWEMILSYPDTFSAAAPICGGGMGWRAFYEAKTPTWAFHGSDDDIVPLSASLEMYNGMKKKGLDVRLYIIHGETHEIWNEVYHNTRVIDWLVNSVRKHD